MDIELMQNNAQEAASVLKCLANPSRLLLLCALVTRSHTVGELVDLTGLSQSAVSQHLAGLRERGIVATRREAKRVFYSLDNLEVRKILETVHELYCD